MRSTSAERMAEHRSRRKEAGEIQSTVWLSHEEAIQLEELKRQKGLASRAEALQMVIKSALNGNVIGEARA